MAPPKQIRCSDVYELTRWALKEKGVETSFFESPQFSDDLIRSFERWYENHAVKFPALKKAKLKKILRSDWKKISHNKDCSLFSSFLPEKEFSFTIELAKIFLQAVDPYTTYFTKSEFEDFYEGLSGAQSGFGLKVKKSLTGLKIDKVYTNSPASRAGLKPGDVILTVNSQDLKMLSFQDSTELLKHEKIELTVASNQRVFKTELKKESGVFEEEQNIQFRIIQSEMGKKMVWVKIPQFYGRGGFHEDIQSERSSSEDFYQVLIWLQKKLPQHDGMVIDLRGNPGGYIEEAVKIAGYLLGSQTIVKVQSKNELKAFSCTNCSEVSYKKPVIVWIDQETASSAEILTAALKDYDRALVIGTQRTFGKGSVQKLIALDDPYLDMKLSDKTGFLKVTTSRFYSPSNQSPEGRGVDSHLEVRTNRYRDDKRCAFAILEKIESLDFFPDALLHRGRSLLDGSAPEECLQD